MSGFAIIGSCISGPVVTSTTATSISVGTSECRTELDHMQFHMSEADHRRVHELLQQDLQETFNQECEEEGAKAMVQQQDEQDRIEFTTAYLDELVKEKCVPDDVITNSNFPEDEKTFTANLLQMNGIVQEKFEVVESQAKRMRMEALQRKPSDEVTTASQLAAQVQPSPKTSKSVDVAVEKAAGSAPIAPVRTKEAEVKARTMSDNERKEWKGFLADVDEDGVEVYKVEALLRLFELNKLWRPSILVFLHQEADLVSLQSYGELQPSEKKLLKKTVSMATTVTELKRILESHFQG